MARPEADNLVPTRIVVHQASRVLELEYADGRSVRLPFEFLRVYSPSAEVRGHGPGQEVLQTGKAEVGIVSVEPVGHYAIQPRFTDGHATGIYSWEYLHRLGQEQEQMWQAYLERLQAAGASRQAQPGGEGAGKPGPGGAAPGGGAAPAGGKSVTRPR